ncbi:uncharacterized protein LOC126726330 [Quercus robur]|uniref:uncharacterized protein LOC126726330 n=1 Tax=Quercus robur TaxID=38942 RepID=UPI0021614812|nr:uncharacterized protein LOC126726330 [Quercus robur]
MKECLIILSVIVVFIVFEYFIERVRDRVLDVAIPVALMGVFVTALRFLFLTTFPRCIWLRWVIVVVLCAAFYLSFDNRALIHPRSRRADVCRYDLKWKERYFKSEESYQKQWRQKIDLEKNLSILESEKNVLQKQCIEDKNTLTINSENQKKLASEQLEVAKEKIQELERRCRDDRS